MPGRLFAQTAMLSLVVVVSFCAESPARAEGSYPARCRCLEPAHALVYQPIDKIVWDESPLEDVMTWLRDLGKGKVNVLPRWRALRTVGIDESTTVSFTLHETTVAEVLAEIIEQLEPIAKLAYRAYGNKFILSSQAYFDRQLFLRVYNVTDIVSRVVNNGGSAPVIDLSQTTGGVTPTGGGGVASGTGTAGTVFGGGGGQQNEDSGANSEQEEQERLDRVVALIQNIIEPASWASAGQGRRGQIRAFDKQIIVLNTIEVHEKIAGRFVR